MNALIEFYSPRYFCFHDHDKHDNLPSMIDQGLSVYLRQRKSNDHHTCASRDKYGAPL